MQTVLLTPLEQTSLASSSSLRVYSRRSSVFSLGPGSSPWVLSSSWLRPKLAILFSLQQRLWQLATTLSCWNKILIQCSRISNKLYLKCNRRWSRDSACFSLILPFPEFRKARFLETPPHTLFVTLPTCILRELLASTTAIVGIRPKRCIMFALYWRQDTRSLKPGPCFEVSVGTKTFFLRKSLQCCFALHLAFIKLNQSIHTRKPFNCGVPFSGAHSAELLQPRQGSSLLTQALWRLMETLMFSHSATALGAFH